MRTSDAARVDPHYRAYRKAQTLKESLERRWTWYAKHVPDRLTAFHKLRRDEITRICEAEISEADRGRPLLWEINTYLSRRPVLSLPIEEITNWVYYNLPPPKRANLSELETHMASLMTQRYHEAQAKQHYFALMCEIAYRAKQNWYMVFNTLTLSPRIYYEIVHNQSPAYKAYVRKLDREVAIATAGSYRKAQLASYHTYFTCTEQGAQNGRLHLHCMHMMAQLPHGCTDPNYGRNWPDGRNLLHFEQYWPHGRSEPRIVRYSPNDAFGLAGYRWPIDNETNEPLEIKSPIAVANYISKYVEKGYHSCLRNKLKWRVKKSQKLGHALLNEMLEPLSTSTLLTLASLDSLKLKLNNTSIPLNLLRHLSLKILHHRSSSTNQYGSILQIARHITPRLSPLHSLRASTQTILENSQQSTQFLSTLGLSKEDISNALDEARTQRKLIDDKYFPRNQGIHGTASSANNQYHRQKYNKK